jgi:hypothetical protein
MVSCAKELFRRQGRDETFRTEMRVISMRLKYEEFGRGKVSFCRGGIVVLQKMAFRDHMTLLSECVTNVAF